MQVTYFACVLSVFSFQVIVLESALSAREVVLSMCYEQSKLNHSGLVVHAHGIGSTPVCLGEWSGTLETSKDVSKKVFFFSKSILESEREFVLSNFHVDFFFALKFSLLPVFSHLKRTWRLILQQQPTLAMLHIMLIQMIIEKNGKPKYWHFFKHFHREMRHV